MTHLTFGVRSSSFVTTAVIRHNIKKYKKQFPDAAAWVLNLTWYKLTMYYMAATLLKKQSIKLMNSLCQLFNLCDMILWKLRKNSSELWTAGWDYGPGNQFPGASTEDTRSSLECLDWQFPHIPTTNKVTKRRITSWGAKLYDLLGVFASLQTSTSCSFRNSG